MPCILIRRRGLAGRWSLRQLTRERHERNVRIGKVQAGQVSCRFGGVAALVHVTFASSSVLWLPVVDRITAWRLFVPGGEGRKVMAFLRGAIGRRNGGDREILGMGGNGGLVWGFYGFCYRGCLEGGVVLEKERARDWKALGNYSRCRSDCSLVRFFVLGCTCRRLLMEGILLERRSNEALSPSDTKHRCGCWLMGRRLEVVARVGMTGSVSVAAA
nr:hypothetical protein CFP56_02988 [Quercus suber]